MKEEGQSNTQDGSLYLGLTPTPCLPAPGSPSCDTACSGGKVVPDAFYSHIAIRGDHTTNSVQMKTTYAQQHLVVRGL